MVRNGNLFNLGLSLSVWKTNLGATLTLTNSCGKLTWVG